MPRPASSPSPTAPSSTTRARRGHAYSITVQASDGTLTSSQTFTIGVTDVAPSTPTDSDAAANTVVEGAANGSTVGITASSTDVNGPAVTYSLIGDTAGGGFTINASTGVVTVADATQDRLRELRRPATPSRSQASDGTLTARRPSPSPSPTSRRRRRSTATRPTRSRKAPPTARPSASPHRRPTSTARRVTYSLTGDSSGGGFTINAATGVVTVADATQIDYETAPVTPIPSPRRPATAR